VARGIMMRELNIKTARSKAMGQSIAEYGILISVIAAALLAMQIYMKRSIQAVIKCSTDQFGNQDWLPDAEDAVITDVQMETETTSESRVQQQSREGRSQITYTTDETTENRGTSVYASQEKEL
jgi:hypothetical protein